MYTKYTYIKFIYLLTIYIYIYNSSFLFFFFVIVKYQNESEIMMQYKKSRDLLQYTIYIHTYIVYYTMLYTSNRF